MKSRAAVAQDTIQSSPEFADVYRRLKAMASRQRARGGSAGTLCTTEIVHEAYMRMGAINDRYDQSAQFFAYAARAMRHILTDAARRRMQAKRGGDRARVDLADPMVDRVAIDSQIAIELDDALVALEREDQRAARVVELHYFAGLPLEEIAEILGVVRRTVDRDWRYARAFLASRAV